VIVAVSSTKPIASVPMLSEVAGGHSWRVGKSPSVGDAPGVQAGASFEPPLHLCEVALQIGQGWMNVLHVPPPGQSALVMQPLALFVPPEHASVSPVAVMVQSAAVQQS